MGPHHSGCPTLTLAPLSLPHPHNTHTLGVCELEAGKSHGKRAGETSVNNLEEAESEQNRRGLSPMWTRWGHPLPCVAAGQA